MLTPIFETLSYLLFVNPIGRVLFVLFVLFFAVCSVLKFFVYYLPHSSIEKEVESEEVDSELPCTYLNGEKYDG